jgi:hypothetical protein
VKPAQKQEAYGKENVHSLIEAVTRNLPGEADETMKHLSKNSVTIWSPLYHSGSEQQINSVN